MHINLLPNFVQRLENVYFAKWETIDKYLPHVCAGNRTEGRPRIRWATFRPTNGRKVTRLQHLFLVGRPSVRLTDGRSRVYNICFMLCFPSKIFLPPGIPNYIETILGGKVGS